VSEQMKKVVEWVKVDAVSEELVIDGQPSGILFHNGKYCWTCRDFGLVAAQACADKLRELEAAKRPKEVVIGDIHFVPSDAIYRVGYETPSGVVCEHGECRQLGDVGWVLKNPKPSAYFDPSSLRAIATFLDRMNGSKP
jgi:hypothetical protein